MIITSFDNQLLKKNQKKNDKCNTSQPIIGLGVVGQTLRGGQPSPNQL
jgi:hypothetical protein